MTSFGEKLERLLSSRADIINRMHRPPPAEGNDLERLFGLPPFQGPSSLVPSSNVHVWSDEQASSFCAVIPPIETFMEVPDENRREQFFSTAQRDDILIGVVTVIQDSGIVVTIMACDQGPRRDFDGLKLTGFCPIRQLPRYTAYETDLDAFQVGDKVRAFILDIHSSGRLILSMNPKTLNRDVYCDIKLGLLTDEELPLHYKKMQNLDGKSYQSYLESTPQFRNPDGLQALCKRMGIPRSSACSLLQCVNQIRLPKSEMACELRRSQLMTFSMKHVAQGVKYFKEGRNTDALQSYTFAIEVEPTNPDAYVARGALYASVGKYAKALEELDKSLELQANHVNAKNYLGQTLIAYATELNRSDPTKAEQLLRRALEIDANNREARDALKELSWSNDMDVDGQNKTQRLWSLSPEHKSPVSTSAAHPQRSVVVPSPKVRSRHASTREAHDDPIVIEQQQQPRPRHITMTINNRPEPSRLLGDRSPSEFVSPYRSHERKRTGHFPRDDVKSEATVIKSSVDREDLAKIVITRNRSGRTIRCKDDTERVGQRNERHRRSDSWKKTQEDHVDRVKSKHNHHERNTKERIKRRTHSHSRDSDAKSPLHRPMDVNKLSRAKELKERIQAQLRDIELRHEDDDPSEDVVVGVLNGGPAGGGFWRADKFAPLPNADHHHHHEPLNSYDSRGDGYRGRGRGGGAYWPRGQWGDNDYRGRRGNWSNNRYFDRRRDGHGGGGGGYDRNRRRRSSRSYSRSDRSSSDIRSPVRQPINRRRVITRVVKTPPLAPLTNPKRSDSYENLAELDQFVEQLKAKRDFEEQYKQQVTYMTAQMQEQHNLPAYPGEQPRADVNAYPSACPPLYSPTRGDLYDDAPEPASPD